MATRLRPFRARQASARVRAIRNAYTDFDRTLRQLDRIERLGRRLQSAVILDSIVAIRGAVIDACAPRKVGS